MKVLGIVVAIIVLLLAELTALLYEIQLFYDVSVVVPT